MLALLYLVAAAYFGDRICRGFYRFISIQHRLATSFLVGLLLSTWIIYLGSLAFARLRQPLIAGNIVFLLAFALACYKLPREACCAGAIRLRPAGSSRWDWLFLGAFLVIASWLMFATLGFRDGQFQIAFKSWTDFGANVSLVQSFALGHNFPPEHPFFPGELIRYHFLFWFQAANLQFLGLNPVWSINLLSILSMLALLVLIATFAEVLFDSRVAGRIAASLFFFSSSLSYLPFLRSQPGFSGAVNSIVQATDFLASGYPFRGETWGALSLNVFGYQRHLISGIGMFFVVMIFLVDRYCPSVNGDKDARSEIGPLASTEENETLTIMTDDAGSQSAQSPDISRIDWKAFVFSGALIGLLPYWNSPVFVSAMIILGCVFLLFPYRLYTAAMIGAAVLVGLPQVLLLESGSVASSSIFHWGYTLEQPTLALVVKYLGWTFGVKWLLVAIALVLLPGFHRRLFVALSSLVLVVFIFQLSTDIFNNHKLLNIWAIFANVYAAYVLWRIGKNRIAGTGLAIALAVAMIFGGFIDLFPIHNDPMLAVPYQNDRLTQWLLNNTRPSDVFLTQTLLTHPILFTGRKIYLGYTLFAWTAGYNVSARESIYRRMFEEENFAELTRLLNDNKIAYVAIDDGVRENQTIYQLNEPVYQQHFEKVFQDTENRYGNLTIYKVPRP
jgi:hypothetical protein